MIKKHLGKVIKGKFIPHDRQEFLFNFARLEGKEVEVTVNKYSKKRTTPQNKYYWGVILPMISEEIGEMDINETHEYLKHEFLKVYKGDYTTFRDTKSLKTNEFTEYIETIRIWAASFLHLPIPDPSGLVL